MTPDIRSSSALGIEAYEAAKSFKQEKKNEFTVDTFSTLRVTNLEFNIYTMNTLNVCSSGEHILVVCIGRTRCSPIGDLDHQFHNDD